MKIFASQEITKIIVRLQSDEPILREKKLFMLKSKQKQ